MAEEKTVGQELMTENERLREENKQLRDAIRLIARADGTVSVCDGNVTVTIDAFLTAEEREALRAIVSGSDTLKWQEIEATVRTLLERTK